MSVCGLQATHRPTIVAGLLRQSCRIKVSLLGGVWMANDGSLLEVGGASFVNFVKIEGFGGYILHACSIWDFEDPLHLVGEVDDVQPAAHFWRQEYDFWSSPPKGLPQEGRVLRRV